MAGLVCPACGGELTAADNQLSCATGEHEFPVEAGIPRLFWPHEPIEDGDAVTARIRGFYETNPFPGYEGIDDEVALRRKARSSLFPRLLDDQIPARAAILEVGCGTGQLSNYLAMTAGRTVFGADLSLGSLTLAQRFKETNRVTNLTLLQMNLFRPAFAPESFDFVIANGVLHHTADPFGGLRSISRLLKPGGFIVVGLYNRYGRVRTHLNRLMYRVSGRRGVVVDEHFHDVRVDESKRQTWFADQYENPHESTHSYGEVLAWFDALGLSFVNSIPKSAAFAQFSERESLFETTSAGSGLDRMIVQAGLMLKRASEGGFFIMIGRRAGGESQR